MANIYFKHLSLTNFMSYEKAEIDLNRSGSILVGGINNNPEDSAKSNGCGKSSLFSALSWCLTGETVSGAKEVSNIYTNGKTEVSIVFDFDGDTYKLTRTKNPSNLFIYVNGENKSGKGIRDTSEIVKKYLPQLHSSLLNSVIILGQGLPQRFTNNTPSGRKEVLETLSNSDCMIVDLRERLNLRKEQLSAENRSLEDSNLKITTEIDLNKKEINNIENEILNLSEKDSLEKEREDLIDKIDKAQEELNDLVEFIKELKSNFADKQTERNIVQNRYFEEVENLEFVSCDYEKNSLLELKADISSLNSKINELENIIDVCPTCGQKLPNIEKIDTTDLRKELDSKKEKQREIEKLINDIENKNNKIRQDCNKKYNENLSALQEELDTIFNDISLQEDKLHLLSKDNESKNDRLKTVEQQITNFYISKEEKENKKKDLIHKNELLENNLSINNEKLMIINERLSINSKMQTLIKRDFRGYLLNNVISFIEERAKIYSQEIFGTDKLKFELANNNIDISYDNKDYSVLSGGEKQKLDIIIQFAIRDMLCTFLDFSSNILVLDEITDSLDSIGVSKIFNLISSNLNDVEAIYIISHHVDELEIPADDEIIIIKGDDKISRIV